MKWRLIKAVLLVMALVIAVGVVVMFATPRWQAHQLMRQSEPIQASLESYRRQHGRYPGALSEVGVQEREEGPIYYRRESDTTYLLWFGTSLGESLTFNSNDHKWR